MKKRQGKQGAYMAPGPSDDDTSPAAVQLILPQQNAHTAKDCPNPACGVPRLA